MSTYVQYVTHTSRSVRRVGNFYYDLDFALLIFRNCLLASGSITQTMCRVTQSLASAGCETTALLPSMSGLWAKLLEDVFYSPGVEKCLASYLDVCHEHSEFESLSIDCTFRLAMSLQGQVSYRAPAAVRLMSALPQDDALHAVLSVRGKTGAVVALVPLYREKSELVRDALQSSLSATHRGQVKHIVLSASAMCQP